MSIKFTVIKTGDVTILDAKGSITLREGSSALRDTIRKQLKDGAKKIVLNFEEVSYIDSFSIGEIVSGRNEALSVGGEIKLVALNTRTRDLLLNTKLYDNFDIHADVESAVRCFGGEHIGCTLKRP